MAGEQSVDSILVEWYCMLATGAYVVVSNVI